MMKPLYGSLKTDISSISLPAGFETGKSVIAEISGRDSLAAVLKYCSENSPDYIFPTFAYTGTEYGDFNKIEDNISLLEKNTKKKGSLKMAGLIIVGDPKLWWILNGRFGSQLNKRFGFFSPCIGCHLYFHLVRLPLADKLNVKTIISGERNFHEKKVKINQTKGVLRAFKQIFSKLGFDLVTPIENIADNKQIDDIVGYDADWNEMQLKCVLSSNYLSVDKKIIPGEEDIEEFVEKFLVPAGIRIGENMLSGKEISEDAIKKVLERS